jgi:gp45 sliding clamp, C terminal
MKLSEYGLSVLKNFAAINPGMVIRKGKVQQTISQEENILVRAELEDEFTIDFGIADLNQFLGNVTTLQNPELSFTEKMVTMDDGSMTMDYLACPIRQELIKFPPDKPFDMKDPDVTFDLPYASLTKILKLAAMNGLTNLSLVSDKGEIKMRVHDKKNDTSNFASTVVGKTDKEFSESFVTDNLKILQDDYTVEMKFGAFAKFTGKKTNVKYFIAFLPKKK